MNAARPFAFARTHHRSPAPQRAQRGVVIFIALIVLVAMTLAGIAMMRSSGSAMLTAGNLGFRQNATASGDLGLETARAWLTLQGPVTLELRNPSRGYYATWNDLEPPLAAGQAFDPLLWGESNWNNSGRAVQVNSGGYDAAGNKVSFVIHRMCALPGAAGGTTAPANQECVTAPYREGRSRDGKQNPPPPVPPVYFRVTARIEGPKNTVSYVQTMVY